MSTCNATDSIVVTFTCNLPHGHNGPHRETMQGQPIHDYDDGVTWREWANEESEGAGVSA